MKEPTSWRCPHCYGRNFSIPCPGVRCVWCGWEIEEVKEEHDEHRPLLKEL